MHTEQPQAGPKCTAAERKGVEREFEPKTRLLCLQLGLISHGDRQILTVCRKLSGEVFHYKDMMHLGRRAEREC
jgi:hypothetical protein